MLIDIQDDIAPIFTESIHNESVTNKVKYEIIVVLHNLLCINTDIRVRKINYNRYSRNLFFSHILA